MKENVIISISFFLLLFGCKGNGSTSEDINTKNCDRANISIYDPDPVDILNSSETNKHIMLSHPIGNIRPDDSFTFSIFLDNSTGSDNLLKPNQWVKLKGPLSIPVQDQMTINLNGFSTKPTDIRMLNYRCDTHAHLCETINKSSGEQMEFSLELNRGKIGISSIVFVAINHNAKCF